MKRLRGTCETRTIQGLFEPHESEYFYHLLAKVELAYYAKEQDKDTPKTHIN